MRVKSFYFVTRLAILSFSATLAAMGCGRSDAGAGDGAGGAAHGSPCDDAAIDKDLKAFDQLKPGSGPTLPIAAAMLLEDCHDATRPMPTGLREAFDYIAKAGDSGMAVVAAGLADLLVGEPDLWPIACGHSAQEVARALGEWAKAGGGDASAACSVERQGFVSADEARAQASQNVILAAVAHAWLVRDGMEPERARSVARLLAGLPSR